ncbi:DUF2937 family protein [Alisedimentitalea sp. MJ-SS2]|uniref:DUF2937 family protein n=1 Tax=Aliisedimentitalea sp. MJ-SS2 TaxID=3049795 RepID=UPI00290A0904|nr:DUF2937 family protein [Alisedimentitalea sp. MJ-SS2]MDU8928969.1 DUF2937 family protein [Alisedimentitalea sp. MJ-SS2]
MLLRTITLAGGLAGAAGMSQFPEFSQQYVQRLGGAVDELSRFVEEFDADAARLNLSREAALQDLAAGGAMGAERAGTVGATLARHARLSADLQALQAAGPFTRAYRATRLTDTEIATNAWTAFKPAMPLTFEGASFAGIGFLGGILALGGVFALLRRLFGRRKPTQAEANRLT